MYHHHLQQQQRRRWQPKPQDQSDKPRTRITFYFGNNWSWISHLTSSCTVEISFNGLPYMQGGWRRKNSPALPVHVCYMVVPQTRLFRWTDQSELRERCVMIRGCGSKKRPYKWVLIGAILCRSDSCNQTEGGSVRRGWTSNLYRGTVRQRDAAHHRAFLHRRLLLTIPGCCTDNRHYGRQPNREHAT